jgi:hypothetical protein
MPKTPRRPPPQTKESAAAVAERVAGRAIVARPIDPRHAGLFDAPLPKWIRQCLPTLVDKLPVGDNWIRVGRLRISAYVAEAR